MQFGLLLGPQEALSIGLVDEIVPLEQVDAVALKRCLVSLRLSSLPPRPLFVPATGVLLASPPLLSLSFLCVLWEYEGVQCPNEREDYFP